MTDPHTPETPAPQTPAPTQAPTPEDWFGDVREREDSAVSPTTDGRGPSRRQWVTAGLGAAGIVVAAIVGIVVVRGGSDGDDAAGQGPGGGFPGRGGFSGDGVAGTVTGIDGSTLTVEDAEGETVTVATSGDTIYTETVEGSLDDIEPGDEVLVMGSGDDDIEAQQVSVGATLGVPGGQPGGQDGQDGAPRGYGPPDGGGFPGGGGIAFGTVEELTGDGFTVDTGDGTVTVTTMSSTDVTTTEEVSFDDVDEGDTVRVTGETENDTVNADSVSLGDTGIVAGPGGGFAGDPGDNGAYDPFAAP